MFFILIWWISFFLYIFFFSNLQCMFSVCGTPNKRRNFSWTTLAYKKKRLLLLELKSITQFCGTPSDRTIIWVNEMPTMTYKVTHQIKWQKTMLNCRRALPTILYWPRNWLSGKFWRIYLERNGELANRLVSGYLLDFLCDECKCARFLFCEYVRNPLYMCVEWWRKVKAGSITSILCKTFIIVVCASFIQCWNRWFDIIIT